MPNNLPPNWSWVKLGDVCEPPQYGYTTSASSDGDLKFLRTTDITAGYINWDSVPFCKVNPKEIEKYLLKENDVVISRAGSVGYSFLLSKSERAVFASYLIRFRPKTNPKFFALFLQSPHYWDQISEKKLGIAVPNVNATKLKDINFPLPPLPEQKKIVEKIEELFSGLDSGVASLKKAKEQLRLYRQSVLASAFTGKLLTPSAERQAHSEMSKAAEPKVKYSNQLPDGWEWVNIRDISDDMMIGIVKSSKDQFNDGRGVPYIKMNNVSMEGTVDTIDVVNVEVTKGELEKYHLKKDDILFNTRNSFELVGKTGILREERTPRVFNNNLLRIRVNKEFNPYFINYQMNSQEFRDKLKTGKRATTNICAIYQKDLFPMTLKVPPLTQQTQIVSEIEKRFSEADNLEKAIDDSLAKSETLRQSILKKAFEGRLI